MAKYNSVKHLTKAEQEELFIDFTKALAAIKSSVEAANFIKDLLSEVEVSMLSRRLQIARLILDGYTYEQIQRAIKASNTTIAKVHIWLDLYGEGYRTIVERTKEKVQKSHEGQMSWGKIKRKYPMYFWPELVLEEIIRNANIKQKRKLTAVLGQMKEKTKLSKQLIELLKSEKSYHSL